MKLTANKSIILFIFLASVVSFVSMLLGEKSMAEELTSVKVSLEKSTESELIDFLYQYSKENRLNVQWFGWVYSEEPTNWYEKDRKSNFKINLHLLTEKNGYIYLSSGFNNKSVNMIIDTGSEKSDWIAVVEDFKRKLKENGYRTE